MALSRGHVVSVPRLFLRVSFHGVTGKVALIERRCRVAQKEGIEDEVFEFLR